MIVDLLVAVLAGWGFAKVRKKMNLSVTIKHWVLTIIIVFVGLAIIYGASGHVSSH